MRIEILESNDKERPICATIFDEKDMPVAVGVYEKERILQIIKEQLDRISSEPDLKLCTENIETLGNAIRRIDDDIDTIKKTHKNIEIRIEAQTRDNKLFKKSLLNTLKKKNE